MPRTLGYHPSLDGIRAIAVTLVVLFHFHVAGFDGGFLGVDIFFVLSGFLITRLLLKEWDRTSAIRLRAFYARRALRLLPALLLLLVACAWFVSWQWLLAALSYVGNWFLALHVLRISPISHTWSLAIEEQFYLVWPLVLLLLLRARLSRTAIARIALVLAAAASIRKVLLCIDHDPGTWMRIYFATDTRADALLIGCAAAALSDLQPRMPKLVSRALFVLASAGIAYFVVTARINDLNLFRHGSLTLLAVCVAVVVVQLAMQPWRPVEVVLAQRPLVALGRISYGVYLWHHAIMFLEVSLAASLALTLAAAIGSYFLVERPALALKARFAPA